MIFFVFFFFNDRAPTGISTLPYTTLFRSQLGQFEGREEGRKENEEKKGIKRKKREGERGGEGRKAQESYVGRYAGRTGRLLGVF